MMERCEISMSNLVQLDLSHSLIAIITLNRPEAANAMSNQLLDELNIIIDKIEKNEQIYCVIITGAGEKAFCAGADLIERRGMNDRQVLNTVMKIGQTISRIEQLSIPVIASINGAAFGGGLELALGCDIRIASSHVKLGLTETSLAIIPGAGGTQRLPRLIGIGKAKQLIYTAKRINASDAKELGLIEEVVEHENLMKETLSLAKEIAVNGPVALRLAKKAINQGIQVDLNTGLEIEHLCYQGTLHTEDRKEGLRAFKEKRKPIYKGI